MENKLLNLKNDTAAYTYRYYENGNNKYDYVKTENGYIEMSLLLLK